MAHEYFSVGGGIFAQHRGHVTSQGGAQHEGAQVPTAVACRTVLFPGNTAQMSVSVASGLAPPGGKGYQVCGIARAMVSAGGSILPGVVQRGWVATPHAHYSHHCRAYVRVLGASVGGCAGWWVVVWVCACVGAVWVRGKVSAPRAHCARHTAFNGT